MSARYRCNQCLHEFTVSEDMGSQSCPYCGSFELTEKSGGLGINSVKLKKLLFPALAFIGILVLIIILKGCPPPPPGIKNVEYDTVRNRITVTANSSTKGGKLEYSFDNGKTWQTSRVFQAQDPGTHIIVVKDNRNNTTSWGPPITVIPGEDPPPPQCLPPELVGVEIVSETVRGLNDGQIKIHTLNGCRPLEFSINNGLNWTKDSVFMSLQPGIYFAEVKDSLTRTARWQDTIRIERGPQTGTPPSKQETEDKINKLFNDPDNRQLLDSVNALFISKTMNVECELIGITPNTPYQLFQFLERRFEGKPGTKRIEIIDFGTSGSRISRLRVKEVPVR